VLDAARPDEHLTRLQLYPPVAELNRHLALDDEDFVRLRVAVLDELALDARQLEIVVVHPRHNPWRPALRKLPEFFAEVDRLVLRSPPQNS
jgi:hypothetical protein